MVIHIDWNAARILLVMYIQGNYNEYHNLRVTIRDEYHKLILPHSSMYDDIIATALFTIHESLFILTATIYPPLPQIQYLLECPCYNTQVTEAAVA